MAKDRAEALIQIREELEKHWREAKERQAKYYDQKHSAIEYNVGEMVLISSQNIQTTQPTK
jgi:hypothetical protein